MLMMHKILPMLVLPLGFSLLCMLVGLVFHRRLCILLGVLVLMLFSMPVVSDILMRAVECGAERSQVSTVGKADAIVVLSGMIAQVRGAPLGEWGDAADRFEGGIELYKSEKAPVLVFTGGQVPWQANDAVEGELLKKRAVLLGIPPKLILLTGKAGNTAEEAIAASKLLGVDSSNRKRIILVTSAYHMRRAILLFERVGFTVKPYRVDIQTDNKQRVTVLRLLPSPGALVMSETALREIIGLLYYRLINR